MNQALGSCGDEELPLNRKKLILQEHGSLKDEGSASRSTLRSSRKHEPGALRGMSALLGVFKL